jgi:pyruvate,water dikinase
LPVPPGVLVVEEALTHSLHRGWIRATGEGFVIADQEALQKALDLPPVASRVAVRSAFSREDGESQSLAGYFASFLNVPFPEVWPAVCRVWNSSHRLDASFRRDVLIMAMVDARHAGVAVTETEYEDDLVNVTQGLGDRLVSGLVAGETLHLPKLRAFEKPTEAGFAELTSYLSFASSRVPSRNQRKPALQGGCSGFCVTCAACLGHATGMSSLPMTGNSAGCFRYVR